MALIEVYGGQRSLAFELTYGTILQIFIIQLFPNWTASSAITFNNYSRSACCIWVYELAIIVSYPTSARGIIVLLKTPTKYQEFFQTLFVKTTDFWLVFNFAQTRTVTMIFGDCRIMGHAMMAKPIRALALHYPMIQFLINSNQY